MRVERAKPPLFHRDHGRSQIRPRTQGPKRRRRGLFLLLQPSRAIHDDDAYDAHDAPVAGAIAAFHGQHGFRLVDAGKFSGHDVGLHCSHDSQK
jgi:hypothetical protein